MIPLCDLTLQYRQLKSEIDDAVAGVLEAGKYILGPNVRAFEEEVAEHHGCAHAVGVNSGTDALHLALRALGVGPGDEVITTPFTFIATSEAIGMVGATPVFVDIDPETYNLDPAAIPPAITDRTKAILPVHLFGQPCDMDAIMDLARRHSLLVVEDCAQAMGATHRGRPVGTIGDAGCLSFFPSKNLGCMGDGGMVITNTEATHARVEMLRRHGGKVKYHHSELGLNSRLDELQAAILRVKLPHLDRYNELRRAAAYRYNQLFASADGVIRPVEVKEQSITHTPLRADETDRRLVSVYHQYTVRVANRACVQTELQAAKVGCAVYYPVPLHLQELHSDLPYGVGSFPIAEAVANQCLSLPMFPGLTEDQQATVAEAVTAATSQSVPTIAGAELAA